MMTKKFYLHDRFFVSNRNLTTEHIRIIKNSSFFFKISQTPGFSGFFSINYQIPGFLVTLYFVPNRNFAI